MQDYRPPSAQLSESQDARRDRSLPVAAVFGVLAAIAAFFAASFFVATVLLIVDPGARESNAGLARAIRSLPQITLITAAMYAVSAAVGGWCAARLRRSQWLRASAAVGSVLVAIGLGLTLGRSGKATSLTWLYGLFIAGALTGGRLSRGMSKR